MAEWQSIETAPKDGMRIMLFGPASSSGGNSDQFEPAAHVGSWHYERWSVDPYDYYDVVVEPTHWMPLPAPPPASEEDTLPSPTP